MSSVERGSPELFFLSIVYSRCRHVEKMDTHQQGVNPDGRVKRIAELRFQVVSNPP
jgi:hypothetical protein